MENKSSHQHDGRMAFFRLVKAMREAQREYFATRSREALQRSKSLEKRVDDSIARGDSYLNRVPHSPTLFQE